MGTPSQEYRYTAGSSEPYTGGADGNARLRIYLNEALKGTYVPKGDDVDVHLECEGGGGGNVHITSSDNSVHITETPSGTDLSVDIQVNPENVSTIYFLPTMHPASTEQNVDPYYSGNDYYAHATLMFLPNFVKIKPSVSSLITQLTQGSLVNAYMAIYEYDDLGGYNKDNTVRLVARTDAFSTNTAGPNMIQNSITHCYDPTTGNEVSEILLNPDKMYYVVLFSTNNGARFLGRERGTQAQSVPYSSFNKTNNKISNGVLPAVLTPDGYVQSALYHVIRRGAPRPVDR